MNAARPIKSEADREAIRKALKTDRDRLLFTFTINSALRISDILALKVGDVRGKEYLKLKEKKTGKTKMFKLNRAIIDAVNRYVPDYAQDDDWLFPSRQGDKPISRQQAFNILNQAAKDAGLDYRISPHSLRKTWAWSRYEAGVSLAQLMVALNHSSERETLRYIGIEQEDMDELYDAIEL